MCCTLSWARAAITLGGKCLDHLFDLFLCKNVSSKRAGALLLYSLFYFQEFACCRHISRAQKCKQLSVSFLTRPTESLQVLTETGPCTRLINRGQGMAQASLGTFLNVHQTKTMANMDLSMTQVLIYHHPSHFMGERVESSCLIIAQGEAATDHE